MRILRNKHSSSSLHRMDQESKDLHLSSIADSNEVSYHLTFGIVGFFVGQVRFPRELLHFLSFGLKASPLLTEFKFKLGVHTPQPAFLTLSAICYCMYPQLCPGCHSLRASCALVSRPGLNALLHPIQALLQ